MYHQAVTIVQEHVEEPDNDEQENVIIDEVKTSEEICWMIRICCKTIDANWSTSNMMYICPRKYLWN